MTFASEIVDQASDIACLVRLRPARFISDQLVSAGGGVYTLTTSLPIVRVERNGAVLTQVSTNPPSVNDTWYLDESSSSFKVKLAGAPNSTTNVVVVYYYVFLSTHPCTTYETPTDNASAVRLWEPRISAPPTIVESIRDIIAGKLKSEASALTVTNEDTWFQQFLSEEDSFNEKQAVIWFYANDPANVAIAYIGNIRTINLHEDSLSIALWQQFSSLQQAATMGDSFQTECFFDINGFANMDPKKIGTPCRYYAGQYTRYETRAVDYGIQGGGGKYHVVMAAGDATEAAVCTSYSYPVTTSVNRTWGLGRIKGSVPSNTFTSVTRGVSGSSADGNGTAWFFVNGANANYKVGDTFRWTNGGVNCSGIVSYAGAFTSSGNAYNIAVFWGYQTSGGSAGSIINVAHASAGSTSISTPAIGIRILPHGSDGVLSSNVFCPHYGLNYTLAETATDGGNNYVSITFVNSFETHYAMTFGGAVLTALSPQEDTVLFRMSNDDPDTHGSILESFCSIVGMSTNGTTFDDADAEFSNNKVCFSIPQFDEADYGTYTDYAEIVLASTLGYLRRNADNEMEYHLLAAPAASDDDDENTVIEGSPSADIEYNDIITEITTYNPHNQEALEIAQTISPVEHVTSTKAQYLHGVTRPIRMRHVLQRIGDRIDAIMAFRSSRVLIYGYDLPASGLTLNVGDERDLNIYANLGDGSTKSLRILTIKKSIDGVSIEASDLEGL